MARTVLCLVLLLAIGVCVESSPEGRVECIYSSSNQKRPGTYSLQIEDIPTEYCTHVIYDHITFEHSSMTIIPSNPEYDVVQNGWVKFIDLKKTNPKLKLLIVADSVSLIPAFDSSNSHTYLMAPLNNSTFEASDVQDVSITHSVQKWLKNGCPANKMILGVRFTGTTFTLEDPANNGVYAPVNDYGNPCPVTGIPTYCAYFELCQKFNETEWTFKWDEDGACPYAFQGDQWVSYENAVSVEQKASFAKTKGLGGVFSVHIGYDDYRGICGEKYPLIKALWKGFRAKSIQ
ncbi:endochitinase-like [Anopheles coustani]|uniref:endochitinase-like n=1 Tax=Anopheles coustani TaxID=139045 RepID=UPI00265B1644|nr:endochitinase-like [Anopheles coustani]